MPRGDICILDTSVYDCVLAIPGKDQRRSEVLTEFLRLIEDEVTLILPIAVVVETGKHISHCKDGQKRRNLAQALVQNVRDAIAGKAPWTTAPMDSLDDWQRWLDSFPDEAMRGLSIADVSIKQLWTTTRARHPRVCVYVWSLDGHLSSYRRERP